MGIEPRQLRDALGAFATGVTIVTTRTAQGMDVGVTANSFNSVSLDPPLVLWSLAKSSGSLEAFVRADHFAVHVLASDQEVLSNTFARSGIDKFAGLSIERGNGDLPLLQGCSARFQCSVAYQYEGGDHVILVGRVLDFEHSGRKPLAYLAGRYAYTLHKPKPEPDNRNSDATMGSLDRNWLSYLIHRATHQIVLRLRPVLKQHGLDEIDSYVINILLAQDGRSLQEIDALIDEPRANMLEALARLAGRGLIRLEDSPQAPNVAWLTDSGRDLAINILAATKALEEEAERGMEPSEVLLLKELLWKVIHNTNPGVPALWSKPAAGDPKDRKP